MMLCSIFFFCFQLHIFCLFTTNINILIEVFTTNINQHKIVLTQVMHSTVQYKRGNLLKVLQDIWFKVEGFYTLPRLYLDIVNYQYFENETTSLQPSLSSVLLFQCLQRHHGHLTFLGF